MGMARLMSGFAATVGEWAAKVDGALELVFKESAQELVTQLNVLVPRDTGFLAASLVASTAAMPTIRQTDGAVPGDLGEIVLVIAGAELGDTLFLGYTASYSAFVHYGANGRAGRPWVDMVAQRWQQIVAAKSAEVKSRLGL
jgi:hypothetical protein